MHTVAKKVYMSILTCIVILLTMVATTYAWVGILTSGQVSGFDLNLKAESVNQSYSLKISGDGINFGDTVATIDIEKQILKNMGYESTWIDSMTDSQFETVFTRLGILEVMTTELNEDTNTLDKFYYIDQSIINRPNVLEKNLMKEIQKGYYKFDLYLTVEPLEGVQLTTEINANVFLSSIEEMIQGTICTGETINENPFPYLPSTGEYDALLNFPTTYTINSANATRIGMSVYTPIEIDSSYDGTEKPLKTLIYQGGHQLPSYSNGIYDLGGILPKDYNFALVEFNTLYKRNFDIDLISSQRQNDLELCEENNSVWIRPNTVDNENINFLGISNGTRTKIKLTFYFWFEGFDSDCLLCCDRKKVNLNLSFCTDVD